MGKLKELFENVTEKRLKKAFIIGVLRGQVNSIQSLWMRGYKKRDIAMSLHYEPGFVFYVGKLLEEGKTTAEITSIAYDDIFENQKEMCKSFQSYAIDMYVSYKAIGKGIA